jgi:RecB family exonuclease
MRQLFISRRSADRLEVLRQHLRGLPSGEEALLLGATFESIAELTRELHRAFFTWRRTTLSRAALELARPTLLKNGIAAASPLALEAIWARVAHELREHHRLHRLLPLEDKPGLSRALARTITELRMLEVPHTSVEPALSEAMVAYEAALAVSKLADRADLYRLARDEAKAQPSVPLVLLDLKATPGLEQDFLRTLMRRASSVVAVAPADDDVILPCLVEALGPATVLPEPTDTELAELQRNLFTPKVPSAPRAFESFFSAPGEARECVEIARRVLTLAKQGVRFDEMAVLLRAPELYRAPIAEAFRRADIRAFLSNEVPRPDPSGRALVALLRCAEERLSARRFSEYLSLAQVPKLDETGAHPASIESTFARPEAAELLLPLAPASTPPPAPLETIDDVEAPSVLGQLRAPRRWERLIVDAAVIGGIDRWQRRLEGLRHQLVKATQNPTATEAQVARNERALQDLQALEQFALPLLSTLQALPAQATWGEWLKALETIAVRALKSPGRVLALLHELGPMAPVGPLELSEVRAVLSRRLSEVTEASGTKRFGQVFVAPIEAARGLSFHTVFIPGLAERLFPQKLKEDPLLPDRVRRSVSAGLETAKERVAQERLALLLAVGAARTRAVLSYPRIDVEHARPRVPSFYALETARAVQGTLLASDVLQRQAEASANVRLAWPAPFDRQHAIDDTEYDLATIDSILKSKEGIRGKARYLIGANPHVARALRARFARWQTSSLTAYDGLVRPRALVRTALEANHPSKRPFSPTALEQYAACPYKFFLSALVRLEPMDIPQELEELGPLEKGSMAHEVQFRLLSALARDGVVVTPETVPDVLERLRVVIQQVAASVYDEFKPAIERVWHDGVQTLEADLCEWLRKMSQDERFLPAHFELAFGLPGRDVEAQDEASSPKPVTLMESLTVRGSIDLVEKDASGVLRATDYKTGRARAEAGNVIGGGRHLQPVLYALVLEQFFPGATVWGGRLYYTTQAGGFVERATPLDHVAREAFGMVARILRSALETGFFPAMPDEGECAWCSFLSVCGPEEERRLKLTRKSLRSELQDLRRLRAHP